MVDGTRGGKDAYQSQWSIGLKVDIECDGQEKAYFLKESAQMHGRACGIVLIFGTQIIERTEWVDMARAEFVSQTALAAIIPDNVVIPIAYGYFQDDMSRSFYLTRFRDMRILLPPLPQLVAIMKKLHETSISPTGKFGFHCTTYWGPPPIRNEWTDSWEEFWSRQFRSDVAYAQEVCGEDEELATLTEEFIQKPVARLLRPLQTGGRNIKPSLCHGDLWDDNIRIDADTKQPILFDSCAFYGHAEGTLISLTPEKVLAKRTFN